MLYVLWDESHLWGVLMLRASSVWGLPVRPVRASDLAGGLLGAAAPKALIVPGGFASRKAASLGQAGMEAVRAYVAGGGAYLGVCGGAGLGLTSPGGLGLCPWGREPFRHRLQHFASGNVELFPARSAYVPPGLPRPGQPVLAPVWWPAKFKPGTGPAVETVAAYGAPGPGFMMADIPYSLVSGQDVEDWEALYGVRLAPAFAPGDPCIAAGHLGRGRYVLSHAHLETPGSPQANAWLAHILAELTGERVAHTPAPAWSIGSRPAIWRDKELLRAMDVVGQAASLGVAHGLFTWREPWLLGWRQGLPGAQVTGLLAMLDYTLGLEPSPAALEFFKRRRPEFRQTVTLLAKGLSGYLLAERLALTLTRVDPEAVPERALREARTHLFGPPPGMGAAAAGLCGHALSILEQAVALSAT